MSLRVNWVGVRVVLGHTVVGVGERGSFVFICHLVRFPQRPLKFLHVF